MPNRRRMTMADPPAICVIPARGGSKRVPRKNLADVGGQPLISRTIDTVLRSGVAHHTIVSTDDPEIANVARSAGADVPFTRPAELADDHCPTAPVVAHALDATADAIGSVDLVVVVYPAAFLVTPDDLRAARNSFVQSNATALMTVRALPTPIERVWSRADDGTGTMLWPEHALTRTQDLPLAYHDAGQFYIGTPEFWKRGGDFPAANPQLLILPTWRAVDIDTDEDLQFARMVWAGRHPRGDGQVHG